MEKNPMEADAGPSSSTPKKTTSFDDSYFDTSYEFPMGYRFHPSDEVLILSYLKKKIEGQKLPPCRMYDVTLYEYNPEELTSKAMYKPYEDEKWYFFTTRDRKHKIGDRVDRFAGNGYWRRSGGGKDVVSDGSKIGKKEHFVFYIGKPPSGLRTDWNMHEFTYLSTDQERERSGENGMRLDDWILCRIYKYKRATTRRKKEDGEAIEHNLEGQVHPSEENNNNEPALRQSRKKRRIDLSGLCNNGNGTKSYSNKPAATDELDIFEDFTAPTILSPNPFGGSTIPPTNGNNPLYLELMIEHEAANHRTTTQQQHPDNQQGPTNS